MGWLSKQVGSQPAVYVEMDNNGNFGYTNTESIAIPFCRRADAVSFETVWPVGIEPVEASTSSDIWVLQNDATSEYFTIENGYYETTPNTADALQVCTQFAALRFNVLLEDSYTAVKLEN